MGIEMKIAMLGWEYPPFKVGGLGTHCYGLTRSLADKNVKVDFYMPKTKHSAGSSGKKNLVIKEVGETEIFPYDRPDSISYSNLKLETNKTYYDLMKGLKLKGSKPMIKVKEEYYDLMKKQMF